MKEQKTDIEKMIMRSHYLQALEKESSYSPPLSEMERQDFINSLSSKDSIIESLKTSLAAVLETLESLNRQMEQQRSQFQTEQLNSQSLIEQLRSQFQLEQSLSQSLIKDLTNEINSLRIALENQTAYNSLHNKMRFGKKTNKSKSKNEDIKSREEESEDYDGSDDNTPCAPTSSSSSATPSVKESPLDRLKVKSENLDKQGKRRGPYTRRDAARVVELQTRMIALPTGCRFLGYKDVEQYDRLSYIECTSFRVGVYVDENEVRHEFYEPADPNDTRRPRQNVVPGTSATPEFIADQIIDRVMLHIPNHRNNIKMEMERFICSENSRNSWVVKSASLLSPLCSYIRDQLIKVKSILNIDETWCRVRIKFKGDGTKLGKYFKKYIWVIVNKIEKLVYFLYDNDENDSRGHRPIQNFLGGFKGTIQSDGYTVYRQITNDKPDIELILCWAHVHAKLKYAELSGDSNVKSILPLVQRLYSIESECIACHLTPDEIKKRRCRSDVTAVLNDLHDNATRLLNDPHSHLSDMMEKALKYMLNNWDGLLRYRNDGRYTIDNMPAERAIRPFTVNRNNTKFFSSEEGVKVAATLFTIVETARQSGVNVRDYLVYAIREVMNGNKDCSTYTPQAYVAL